MSEISSSKNKSTIYASKIRMRSDQTGTYSATAGWNSVGVGFALTVPETAFYIVKTLASVNVNAGDGRIAIGIDDTPIIYTSQRVYISAGEHYQVVSLETEPIYLTTGQVVTLMMKENSGGQSLGYNASDYGGYISLEQVESSVSVSNPAGNYSTIETDTGKRWIDGKRVYKKVINFGALPAYANAPVAHGITTLDKMVSFSAFADNGTLQLAIPQSQSTDSFSIHIYFTQTDVRIQTWDNYSAYSAYVVMEYTKA